MLRLRKCNCYYVDLKQQCIGRVQVVRSADMILRQGRIRYLRVHYCASVGKHSISLDMKLTIDFSFDYPYVINIIIIRICIRHTP